MGLSVDEEAFEFNYSVPTVGNNMHSKDSFSTMYVKKLIRVVAAVGGK